MKLSPQTEVLSVQAKQVEKLAPSGHIKQHFLRFSQRAAEDCSVLGCAPVLLGDWLPTFGRIVVPSKRR